MFGSNAGESSTISEYFDKKTRLLRKNKNLLFSKVDQVLQGKHEHYFSKRDIQTDRKVARCKVCGILLTEFKAQQIIKKSSRRLKTRKTPAAA